MIQPAYKDKRIFERFKVSLPLKIFDPTLGEQQGYTTDISVKGIGFVADTRLKEKSRIELWLKVAQLQQRYYLRAEVVWCAQYNDGKFGVGVNLEEAKFLDLCRRLMVQEDNA